MIRDVAEKGLQTALKVLPSRKIESMRILIAVLGLLALPAALKAQDKPAIPAPAKFGHLHSADIMSRIPGIAQADTVLMQFQAEIQAKGDSMVNAFKAHYEAYVKDAQSGTLSKMQAQTRESQLTAEQESIQNFEKESQMRILQRRQELYDPILAKVDEAIMAIGKEEGYTMIFDSSQPSMVFLNQAEDISEKVLARLKQ